MNTMIILFALAMCVGCGQSSEQKEESVPTDVTKAEKQEQVQVEAEDEDTLENGEQVFRVVEVYATIRRADDAEYIVRSVLERVKWLDLYGMCRIVCLNPTNDPEIDAIIRRLVQKYPFAEIGAFQTRKNVL